MAPSLGHGRRRYACRGYHASAMTEPSALRARLIAEGLDPGAWSNGPGDRYATHEHGYDKVIVVAAGSIGSGCRRPGGPR